MKQMTRTTIACGSRLVFVKYLDEAQMSSEDQIFSPGDFLVVGAINEDGGLQCFPTDEHGKITGIEGDTVFDEEVTHLSYAPKVDVRVLPR